MKTKITAIILFFLPMLLNAQVEVIQNGNVGIGTNTPTEKLHVHGKIKSKTGVEAPLFHTPFDQVVALMATANSPYYGYAFTVDDQYNGGWARNFGSAYYGSNRLSSVGAKGSGSTLNYLYFDVSNSESNWQTKDMILKPTSNGARLGIGTLNPSTRLQIDDYSPVITLRRNTSSGGYVQGIQTEQEGGSKSWFYGNHDLDKFVISRGAYNSMPLLTITSNNTPLTRFDSRVHVQGHQIKIIDASNPSNTAGSPLHIQNDEGTVSMFLGKYINTAGFLPNESSGDIRFNGAAVAWGDFAYYPTGGDSGEYGHFRLSRAGSVINTTPNAKLGVGSLYVNDLVGINTTSPTADLDVNGDAKVSGSLTVQDVINLTAQSNPPSGAESGDIYLDDGTNTSGNPKLRYFNGSNWIEL